MMAITAIVIGNIDMNILFKSLVNWLIMVLPLNNVSIIHHLVNNFPVVLQGGAACGDNSTPGLMRSGFRELPDQGLATGQSLLIL